MEIVTASQERLQTNVIPPIEVPGSLAVPTNQHAEDEEKKQKQLLFGLHHYVLDREISELSNASSSGFGSFFGGAVGGRGGGGEMMMGGDTDTFTPTESLWESDPASLGTTYSADPIRDDVNATLPLELLVIRFEAPYYLTPQGKKKIKEGETELIRMKKIKQKNVVRVVGVKVVGVVHGGGVGAAGGAGRGGSGGMGTVLDASGSIVATGGGAGAGAGGVGDTLVPTAPRIIEPPTPLTPSTTTTTSSHNDISPFPQLLSLTEQFPSLTLFDVLDDCESLREDRALEYLIQILEGLGAVHEEGGIVHRGVDVRCVGLVAQTPIDGNEGVFKGGVGNGLRNRSNSGGGGGGGGHSPILSPPGSPSSNNNIPPKLSSSKQIKLF
ncbi:hypothetical protein K435DRAFT_905239 [Dendrothele bispora CBS 962.96]|uniref:Protein kinase domain-containing protein n=1 Tax=Dendrothele bispora (strain CBS 962.96) TaxID=1314807 RepID=A0A4S8LUU9_DENBC|nr:hypothetical protein K435DRAFT_905239 [Dendrothele bispora CBS 962.96]